MDQRNAPRHHRSSGGEGIYGTVHFKNLARSTVVPLDEDLNTWILMGPYRYPIEAYSWRSPKAVADG